MRLLPNPRNIGVGVAISLLSLSGSTMALAATATGTSNPDLTISVTVTPDQLHVGDTATATESVANNTLTDQTVTLSNTLVTPKGRIYAEAPQTITITAGQTVNVAPETYVISRSDPRGTYMLTSSATDANGTSSATTHYTVS